MDSPASHAVFKIAHFEKLRSARGEQAERQFRPLPFQMRAFSFATTRPLSRTMHTPKGEEFCFRRPALAPHVEYWNLFQLINGAAIFRAGNSRVRRRGLSGRFRVTLAGGGKSLVEIQDIDPFQPTHAFNEAVFPQTGDLDIEHAIQPLIDRLHPVAGNSPLPADPIDVAMQRHVRSSLPARPSPGHQDTASRHLRNSERGKNYLSRAMTFTSPI